MASSSSHRPESHRTDTPKSERELLYLNNAATSYPKPAAVLDTVAAVVSQPPETPRRGGTYAVGSDIESVRRRIASFLGSSHPRTVSFSSGATASLNLAVESICRGADHVVTTAAEHNAVLRPLYRLREETGLEISVARCERDGSVTPDAVEACLRDNTRAVIVTHGSNVTGAVNDIAEIAAAAHRRGALIIVDAAQTAGHIPIRFDDYGLDVLAVAGHKALYGLSGVGCTAIRADLDLRPLAVGGTGSRSDLEQQPPEAPVRYEAGTPNVCGIASLGAGLTCLGDARRADEMADEAISALRGIRGVRLLASEGGTPTFSFTIDGFTSEEAAMILEESFGMVVRAGLHCAPLIHKALGTYPDGAVRVSFSSLTEPEAPQRLVDAVVRIAAVREDLSR